MHLVPQTPAQIFDEDHVRVGTDHGDDPQQQHHELAVDVQIERCRKDEQQDGQAEHKAETRLDEGGIATLETRGALDHVAAIRLGIQQCAHGGAEREVLARHIIVLADHHARTRELAIEEQVEIEQLGPQPHAHEQGDQQKYTEGDEVHQVIHAVHAADGLAHRVNAIRKRQQRMQRLEEARHHLNGVHARGTRDLHDHEDDADGLADVLERDRQGVNDVHVHERGEHAGEHEQRRMLALDTEDEVARAHDDRLDKAEQDHEHPTTEVTLVRREATQALVIDLELEDGDEHEAANPQREIGVEGRYAGTVIGNRVDRLRAQRHGSGHEIRHVLRIHVEIGRCLGAAEGGEVGRDASERRLQIGQGLIGAGKRLTGLVEHGVELVEHRD